MSLSYAQANFWKRHETFWSPLVSYPMVIALGGAAEQTKLYKMITSMIL